MLIYERSDRVAFLCKVELTSMQGGIPQPAHAINLSLGGLGAVTSSAFSIDELVTVTFFRQDAAHAEAKEHAVGRIAYFTADYDANTVGIQFLQKLTAAEQPWLVAKLLSL